MLNVHEFLKYNHEIVESKSAENSFKFDNFALYNTSSIFF